MLLVSLVLDWDWLAVLEFRLWFVYLLFELARLLAKWELLLGL